MTAALPLENRLALVTGASRGLGRAVARSLAKAGAHVIVTSRTAGALEELDDEIRDVGAAATLLTLDLNDGTKIDQLGPTLYQRFGKLDIFVGNAGILGPLSPLGHVTEDAWAGVIDINLTANWRLIRTLDPLLKKSDAGRAIFVSSGAATGKNAYWGPYAASKAGLEALVKTYAQELTNTAATACLVNPGAIRTQMRARAFPGENARALPAPEDVAPLFVELARPETKRNGELVEWRAWAGFKRSSSATSEL